MVNDSLTKIVQDYANCTACHTNIGRWAYRHVFYDKVIGDPNVEQSDILMVGEGPGRGEDVLGKPFVGVSGKLLRDTIDLVYEPLMRDSDTIKPSIALTNLLVCRPCDRLGGPNRPPLEEEVKMCGGRLMRTIDVVQPKVIVALGNTPNAFLSSILIDIEYSNVTYIHVKHPAAVLRQGGKDSPYYHEYVTAFVNIVRAAINRIEQENTNERKRLDT